VTVPEDWQQRPITWVDHGQANWFFAVLGKNLKRTRLRSFYHKKDKRKAGDLGYKDWWSPEKALARQLKEQAIYIVVGDGGDEDGDITAQPASFGEWDGISREAQASFDWEAYNLPRPTIANWSSETAKTSLHFFFVYTEPVTDIWRWRLLQWRLIRLVGSDPTIANPSRVMRVPGYKYAHPTEAMGWVTIDSTISTGQKISFNELEDRILEAERQRGWDIPSSIPDGAWKKHGAAIKEHLDLERPAEVLVESTPARKSKPSLGPYPAETNFPVSTYEDITEALACIPPRGIVPGTYQRDRNILWGLAAALEAIGRPREEAAAMVKAAGWKDWGPEQVISSGGNCITEGTFWFHAMEGGYKPKSRGPARISYAAQVNATPAEKKEAEVEKKEAFQGIEQCLREAIDLPQAESILFIADLSKQTGVHTIELRKILDGLVQADQIRDRMAAEIKDLKAKQQRKKLSELITLDYLFPPAIAAAIRVKTRYLPCDEMSPAILYATGQSSLLRLGTKLWAVRVSGWSTPLNLFSVLVSGTGTKKSPLKAAVLDQPLQEIQDYHIAQNKKQKENWERNNKGVKPEDKEAKPAPLFVYASKTTPERLSQQMMFQEAAKMSFLLMRDEFAGLIGSIGMYQQAGKGDGMQQILELYDGGGENSMYKTVEGVTFRSSKLSICSNSHDSVIKGYMESGDPQGLWARFCMVPMPPNVVELPEADDPVEVQEFEDAQKLLTEISWKMFKMPPRELEFTPQARAQFVKYESKEAGLGVHQDNAIGALHNKSGGKVVRLAGIFHCLELAAGSDRDPYKVPVSDLDRACNLVNYMNDWMISLVETGEQDEDSGAGILSRVLDIARKRGRPVTFGEVVRSWPKKTRHLVNKQVIIDTFEALAECGEGQLDAEGGFTAN
jgi:hypothetical protein